MKTVPRIWLLIFARVLGLLLVGLVFSGCFPMKITKQPGAVGVIKDSQTAQPLSSVEVAVSAAFVTYVLPEGWTSKVPEQDRSEYIRAHTVYPSLAEAVSKIRPPVVVTGLDGTFMVPPKEGWTLYVMPMDLSPAKGTLVLRRESYEPALFTYDVSPRETNATKNFGDIFLKRLAK